jgi:hypothetical protein
MLEIYGLSGGHESAGQAEHWLAELVTLLGAVDGTVACTHIVRTPHPHVAVSLAVASTCEPTRLPPVAPDWTDAAEQARAEHAARRAGRAVVFPGVDRLVGTLTVAELLARSAIDRVVVLGGGDPDPDTLVDTREFVRPEWREGRLTLVATPAPGGRIAPFEVPNPPQCCADH